MHVVKHVQFVFRRRLDAVVVRGSGIVDEVVEALGGAQIGKRLLYGVDERIETVGVAGVAVIWVVLSVYVCDRVTFKPDIAAVGDDSYDGLDQFIVVVAIFLQQPAILVTYQAWYVCSAVVKRQRASRREAGPFV